MLFFLYVLEPAYFLLYAIDVIVFIIKLSDFECFGSGMLTGYNVTNKTNRPIISLPYFSFRYIVFRHPNIQGEER